MFFGKSFAILRVLCKLVCSFLIAYVQFIPYYCVKMKPKRLYNLNIQLLDSTSLLLSHGDLKTLCSESAALLPTMPNYDKVRRELNRIGAAYASMQRDCSGRVVLLTIVWDAL